MLNCRSRHWSLLLLILISSSLNAQTPGAYMGDLTWPEAEAAFRETPLVILPFGAGAKEHGPHLPMNADQRVMEYLCQKAAEALPVLIASPILHGWFPAFREYPGTEVSDPIVFQSYVHEVARSLVRHGAKRIIFLNTGISRATGLPLSIVAREIKVEYGVPTLVISWDDLETEEIEAFQMQKKGGHGDEIETSIHLFLQPERVKMENARKDYGNPHPPKDYAGYKPGLFSRDTADAAYSATGILGDPTLATEEKGRRTLEIMVKNWIDALKQFSKEPIQGE